MKRKLISKISPLKSVFLICFALFNASCSPAQEKKSQLPYRLNHPDELFILPAVLNEISGNALLNAQTMICVQDESGELFFYHLTEKKIVKRLAFANEGDFEDVTLAGNTAWVLKSNGTLYCINSFEDALKMKVTASTTPLSKANNCEGLCYDPVDEVLLIACKASPASKNYFVAEGKRAIYKFDLKTNTFIEEPAFLISLSKIAEFLNQNSSFPGNKISMKSKSKGFKFEPSAIAVHPISKEIWVMASAGKVIVVLNRKGEIVAVEQLDKNIFPQPEGMTFSADGTLYISSEGAGGSAKLMKFEMLK